MQDYSQQASACHKENFTMTFKALIIEDEQPARDLLKNFLKEYTDIELIGECSDGFEGAKAIARFKPDLIFLDIQMPRISGFEMLELVEEENLPLVIFTTAYDQFAIKAFEFNALDYLLKPIAADRFRLAVAKALLTLQAGNPNNQNLAMALSSGLDGRQHLDRIVLRSGEGIQVIHEEDIFCIEAQDDYVLIITAKEEFLKKKTLKYYEDKLNPAYFLRVHRSFIARLDAIQKVEPYSKDAYLALLKNGRKISVSKSGYSSLRRSLDF
jgi:two-component system, LytTR family, response regulator